MPVVATSLILQPWCCDLHRCDLYPRNLHRRDLSGALDRTLYRRDLSLLCPWLL